MGAPCAANTTSWTYSLSTGMTVDNEHYKEIQTSVQSERSRRGLASFSFTTLNDGAVVSGAHLEELRVAIEQCRAFSWSWSPANQTGQLIRATHIEDVKTNTNVARAECVCYCDWCQADCGCNHCQANCGCNHCQANCGCNHCQSHCATNCGVVLFYES
jgi:hypothetical protein